MRKPLLFTLTMVLSFSGRPGSGQATVMQISTDSLGPGLRVYSGFANGNVLAVATTAGLLLVDAQSEKRVGSLDSALTRDFVGPVRLVVNSHYHPDHTGGNAHFRSLGASVLAHESVWFEASKDTTIAEMDWHRTPLSLAGKPDETFTERRIVRLGEDSLVVWHPHAAHTNGDAIVWIPTRDVVHVGDILERKAPPFVDGWAGGTLAGMIAAIEQTLATTNLTTIYVPGHGPRASRTDVLVYLAMLRTVGERLHSLRGSTTPDEAALGEAAKGYEEELGGPRRAREFIRGLLLAERARRRQ